MKQFGFGIFYFYAVREIAITGWRNTDTEIFDGKIPRSYWCFLVESFFTRFLKGGRDQCCYYDEALLFSYFFKYNRLGNFSTSRFFVSLLPLDTPVVCEWIEKVSIGNKRKGLDWVYPGSRLCVWILKGNEFALTTSEH